MVLSLLLFFGIIILVITSLMGGDEGEPVDTAAAKVRNETLAKMQAAQAAVLPVEVETVFGATAKSMLDAAPAPVKTNVQLVPGSPTWVAKQGEKTETITIDQGDPDAPIDPAVMAAGKGHFGLCMGCHGAEGQGVPQVAPPLAKSEWVAGPIENLIRIQLRGMNGPVTVNGTKYELPSAMMAPLSFQSDDQIAAVLTYIRNSFGNKGTAVTADQVKAFRGEVGKAPVTEEELGLPKAAE